MSLCILFPQAVPLLFFSRSKDVSLQFPHARELSWDLVADTTGYEFDYREQGTTDWLSVSRSVVTSPTSITGLSCGTTYKFIVRAFGDGSPYDMTWGFWSDILAASTDSC